MNEKHITEGEFNSLSSCVQDVAQYFETYRKSTRASIICLLILCIALAAGTALLSYSVISLQDLNSDMQKRIQVIEIKNIEQEKQINELQKNNGKCECKHQNNINIPKAEKKLPNAKSDSKKHTFTLTGYCACEKCCGKWASNRPLDANGNQIVYGAAGVPLREGVSIGVDPAVIPLGTHVIINGHEYIAQDTGNMKGNRIDVYFSSHEKAVAFGKKTAEIIIK